MGPPPIRGSVSGFPFSGGVMGRKSRSLPGLGSRRSDARLGAAIRRAHVSEPLERRTLLAVMITATQQDVLAVDVDADTRFDPGDTIQYNVVISNTGDQDATGVTFTELLSANTPEVLNSLRVSPLASRDTFAAVGNTPRTIAAGAGLRANDIDIDGITP